MAARPMSFVSGGKQERKAEPAGPTIQPPPPPPPPPKRRAGLGAAAAAPPPLPGEKVDRDFATFEAHGKGFGTRMLEKMGWTKGQGIGKSGHGVVNPLESKLRPNSMGLGFGGFKETTAKAKLQQERILHADSERAQLSDESDEELARERRRQGLPAKGASSSSSAAGPEPKRQHWKRHERRELQVKSAADLRQQWAQKDAAAAAASASAASSSATTTTILDMRGPEARVHSSISSALAAQLGDSSAGSSAAVPLTASGLPRADVCPELRHNMRTYIDLAEQELDKKHRELRKEKEALAELTQRRDTQASAARATAARLHEVTQLSQAVKDATHAASEAIARAKAAASANASAAAEATPSSSSSSAESVLVPLEEAAAGWLKVRKEHPEGFATRGLSDVAASMVVEPMRMAFRGWRPLHDPKFGVAMMKGWQKALGGGALGGELLAAGGSGAQALAAGGGQGLERVRGARLFNSDASVARLACKRMARAIKRRGDSTIGGVETCATRWLVAPLIQRAGDATARVGAQQLAAKDGHDTAAPLASSMAASITATRPLGAIPAASSQVIDGSWGAWHIRAVGRRAAHAVEDRA